MSLSSMLPYIIATLVVIVISIIGTRSDGFNNGFKYVLIGIGIIIAFGVVAAIITVGLGVITLPLAS